MIADRIVRNKYKLIGAIIVVLLAADCWLHKGLVRVMLPKKFPSFENFTPPQKHTGNTLINTGKNWIKAVNTVERIRNISADASGIEMDIYYDTVKHIFDVHHDADNSTGLNMETLLEEYQKRQLKASIWMDFKNLNETTAGPALEKLLQLRTRYGLVNKLLVESGRPDLLQQFSDNGFYTCYYTPFCNPYEVSDDSLRHLANNIAAAIKNSSVNALSGYYFQYTYLQHYFPGYDILLWAPNDRYSLVNWLFKKRINSAKQVFIALYY